MIERHLDEFLGARPYRPFHLYLLDGASFEIRHRELAMVEEGLFSYSIPDDPERNIVERDVAIATNAISRVEFEEPYKRTL